MKCTRGLVTPHLLTVAVIKGIASPPAELVEGGTLDIDIVTARELFLNVWHRVRKDRASAELEHILATSSSAVLMSEVKPLSECPEVRVWWRVLTLSHYVCGTAGICKLTRELQAVAKRDYIFGYASMAVMRDEKDSVVFNHLVAERDPVWKPSDMLRSAMVTLEPTFQFYLTAAQLCQHRANLPRHLLSALLSSDALADVIACFHASLVEQSRGELDGEAAASLLCLDTRLRLVVERNVMSRINDWLKCCGLTTSALRCLPLRTALNAGVELS